MSARAASAARRADAQALIFLACAGCCAISAQAAPKAPYSPYANPQHAQRLYWGDTHLHTSYSSDAGMIGNTLGPAEAYRFARGEQVTSSSGLPLRLDRPLDFLVVADHAENLGLAEMIRRADPELLKTEAGREWHALFKQGQGYQAFLAWAKSVVAGEDRIGNEKAVAAMWDEIIAAAEKYNAPGLFTSLIGFEWTSTPQGNNLHRVVVFRDGPEKVGQVLPYSLFDSQNPEDLWRYMAAYEERTGGSVLAIPHNSNLSGGLMFAVETFDGKPFDKNYAQRRMRWEPLLEITQIKGDSETHPKLSPADEFADYGRWDKANILGSIVNEDWMLPYEYARSALKLGMKLQGEIGENPFKYGFIAGTDAHTSVSAVGEENYWGKLAANEPSKDRYKHYVIKSPLDEKYSSFGWQELGSGIAAVWAKDNTREELFDAMRRKETYATTGSRIAVRFFGGWDYAPKDVWRSDMVDIGYARGVPMGGDLKAASAKAPSFMVAAMRDPMGANLDRIQIVKAWVDGAGQPQEKVFNVAVSDGRKIAGDGSVAPVGSTADVATATYSNHLGATELRAVWSDPAFDPAQRAVYYARVLEIPRPTWIARDQAYFDMQAPDDVAKVVQDRAYTSPIWYQP